MSDAPLHLIDIAVEPAWIDYNGHMNMAYYVLAFDKATDVLFDRLGVGQAYRRDTDRTMFAVESHVTYAREAKLGDMLAISGRVVGAGDKRLHFFMRMKLKESGEPVATFEMLALHVDLAGPRVVKFPDAIKARIAAVATEHRHAPLPPELGRKVGLRR
jgi:acyl-CoA thioester hydrolase